MIKLPERLPETGRWRGLAKILNIIRDALVMLQPVPGVTTRIVHAANGFSVEILPQFLAQSTVKGNPSIARYKIVSLDYTKGILTCNPYKSDGTVDLTSSASILIPYFLRKGSIPPLPSGATYTQTADQQRRVTLGNGAIYNETIFPSYFAGQDIYGLSSPSGGTGVAISGAAVTTIDLNVDGRNWRIDLLAVEVCVNNATMHMQVEGTSAY